MIIYQNTLHFEVRLFAVLLVLEFNERILKAVAGTFVTDDLA